MSERIIHQPSPIEILFPQGLALLDPKVQGKLPIDIERWIGGFIIEPKWNGIRAAVEIDNGNIRILTKEGNRVTGLPNLQDRIRRLAGRRTGLVLDGEIISGGGKTDRERQTVINQIFSRGQRETGGIKLITFDVLMFDGVGLVEFPIEGRKRALARLIPQELQAELNIGVTEFAVENHLTFLEGAMSERFEGIVLKRKKSRYGEPHPRSGQPHPWFKYKFSPEPRESENP